MNHEADFLQQVIEALNLEPNTPPEDVPALIEKMKATQSKIAGAPMKDQKTVEQVAELLAAPDPARFVLIVTVQAILAERNTNLATMSEERAREKVADATRKGYLSPAMQDWATALCRYIAMMPWSASSSGRISDLQRA
ncbi:MAG TPA: phage protease [Albidovulum sp.]|uniref:phage protease n=1 Tax=Albidovulum sp. TaxID=1872424 RepID=UPI002C2C5464|nr:phage protease [Albidovulum sp.]